MAERATCGDCRAETVLFYPDEGETLCPDCRSLELAETFELAREARAQPVTIPSYIPRRPFGSGECEVPSSAVVSILAARELEERRSGRVVVGEVVLGGFVLLAAFVAGLADIWLEWAF